MKIFTGEIPILKTADNCEDCTGYGKCNPDICEGQLSILNRCVEVPWEPIMLLCQQAFKGHWTFGKLKKKLEQFIQSEIKKQEGKDHGSN